MINIKLSLVPVLEILKNELLSTKYTNNDNDKMKCIIVQVWTGGGGGGNVNIEGERRVLYVVISVNQCQ